jgi:hypothetical protein
VCWFPCIGGGSCRGWAGAALGGNVPGQWGLGWSGVGTRRRGDVVARGGAATDGHGVAAGEALWARQGNIVALWWRQGGRS